MAKETKFITVRPSAVESTIEMWSIFGWELVGAPQEVYNKDSHLEQRGDSTYSVTETTHYVKVTFQRDKSALNYAELVDLEERYYSLPCNIPEYEPKEPKRFGVGSIILTVLGLCMWVIPGIIIIVYKLVTYPKKYKDWECNHALWVRRDEIKKEEFEIIKRAKSLTF